MQHVEYLARFCRITAENSSLKVIFQKRGVGRLIQKIFIIGHGVEVSVYHATNSPVADQKHILMQAALFQFVKQRIDTCGDIHVGFSAGVAGSEQAFVGEKSGIKAVLSLKDAIILLD